MSAIKENRLNAVVTQIAAIVDESSVTVFNTVKRGELLPQSIPTGELPACYVTEGNERPLTGEWEETVAVALPVYCTLIGKESEVTAIRTELVELESRLKKKLEQNDLGLAQGKLKWIGTDTPIGNQSLPIGSVMVAFMDTYAYQRTDPYLS
jgi:hypothetical protein